MKRTLKTLAVLAAFAVAAVAYAQPVLVKNYFAKCLTAGAGCDNVLNLGGTWKINGTAVTATAAQLNLAGTDIANAAAGVGASYVVARGTITLDGTNPSSATTGLAAIVACTVTDKRSTTPGDDPTYLTTATAAVAGRLDVYAWKTDGSDPTLVASTDADDTIDWICVGT